MKYPQKLSIGRFLKRYKRFFADIELPNQQILTAHCANTGSMLNLKKSGSQVAFLYKDNPKAKLKASWELVKHNRSWVCINTARANSVVAEALSTGAIPEFSKFTQITREQKFGHSRLDFKLSDRSQNCWVEVKSVTLNQGKTALFPDAKTERGLKHLHELAKISATGDRAYIFYLIMRSDCELFKPAFDIDPEYSQTLKSLVAEKKIKALSYRARCSLTGISLDKKIPIKYTP